MFTKKTASPAAAPGKVIKMAPKIAYRNLFHDRMSLIVTLVGIVFSVVLVAIEVGLYKGSENKIATVLDKTDADLWIVPFGTKSFDDPSLLIGHEKYAALSTPGVAYAEDMIVSFSSWRKPEGGKKSFILVGLDWPNGGTRPWNIDEGEIEDIELPNAVAVDRSYFKDLGIEGKGDYAEINSQRVQVTAVTKSIRSFTTLPYTFTPIATARRLTGASSSQATYVLVRLDGRRGGSDARRIPQPQHQVLDVLDRRRSRSDHGHGARRDRRCRHRRTDAVRQHEGPLERVRDPARARSVRQLHSRRHHDPGDPERGAGVRGRHAARDARHLPPLGPRADIDDRHDAEDCRIFVRLDLGHVHLRGNHGHPEGDEDRSGGRLQSVGFAAAGPVCGRPGWSCIRHGLCVASDDCSVV
jgi:hypothetical protein